MRGLDALDPLAERALRDAKIPGLAIAVVRPALPAMCRAWGLASTAPPIAASPSTPFFLASVAKPVVATVIAALVEREMIALDADINAQLPYPFRSPTHPEVSITLRLLLQHRASLVDDPSWLNTAYSKGDHPLPLSDWLKAYFSLDQGGGPRGHGTDVPGSAVIYSNAGYALAAWIAEIAAQMPFDELAQALVFRPLAMHRTSFRLRDVAGAGPAVPHVGGVDAPLQPVPQFGYPFYPVGTLRSPVEDFARFVLCMLQGGSLDGVTIVAPETVAVLLPSEGTGLGWARFPAKGPSVRGHEGASVGSGARVLLDLESKVGVVIAGNAEWTLTDDRFAAVEPLEALALEMARAREA